MQQAAFGSVPTSLKPIDRAAAFRRQEAARALLDSLFPEDD